MVIASMKGLLTGCHFFRNIAILILLSTPSLLSANNQAQTGFLNEINDSVPVSSSSQVRYGDRKGDEVYSNPYKSHYAKSTLFSKGFVSQTSPKRSPENGKGPRSKREVNHIPFSEGLSPTGARTYSIPIGCAPQVKFAPSISLNYNSQAGAGLAGFGWTLGGLSAISISNKVLYYDGCMEAADISDNNAVYTLDGMRLVENKGLPEEGWEYRYPLCTEKGQTLVAERIVDGSVVGFDALFPDGRKAVFGIPGATEPSYIYPLTRIEDIQGNKIEIEYLYHGQTYYPDRILYNFCDGVAQSTIEFDYEDNTNLRDQVVAGVRTDVKKILRSITSNDGANILYRYELEYKKLDLYKHLIRVKCMNEDSSIEPIDFAYGEDDANGSNEIELVSRGTMVDIDESIDSTIYIRGHFDADDYSDGMIMLPSEQIYGKLGGGISYYGSLYDENQEIVIVPRLSDIKSKNSVYKIKVGKGFQTIQAIDIDRDGVDEIVKVNYGWTNSIGAIGGKDNLNSKPWAKTLLTISTYKFNKEVTELNLVGSLETYIDDVVQVKSNKMDPLPLHYMFGFFSNDGHAQLVTISYKVFSMRHDVIKSRTSVFDLTDLKKISETQTPVDLENDDAKYYLTYDIDSDGKSDLCFWNENNTIDHYFYLDGIFYKDRVIRNPPAYVRGYIGTRVHFADINGDGYLDITVAPESGRYTLLGYPGWDPESGEDMRDYADYAYIPGDNIWQVYSFNGHGFYRSNDLKCCNYEYGDKFVIMDIDHDGRCDFVQKSSPSSIVCYLSSNGYNGRAISDPDRREECSLLPINVLSLGKECNVAVISEKGKELSYYKYFKDTAKGRLLTCLEDSYGTRRYNKYSSLTDPLTYSIIQDDDLILDSEYSLEKGFYRYLAPINVLQRSDIYLYDGTLVGCQSFLYYDAIFNNQGLGFSGFARREMLDYIADKSVRYDFDPQRDNVIIEEDHYNGFFNYDVFFEGMVLRVRNTYDENYSLNGYYNPRLVSSSSYDFLTGKTTTVTYSYDKYDLNTRTETKSRIGDGNYHTSVQMNKYKYSFSPERYFIFSLIGQTVTEDRDGDSSSAWMEKTEIEYDGKFRPISTKKYVGVWRPFSESIEPSQTTIPDEDVIVHPLYGDGIDDTNLVSETRVKYDRYGNVLSNKSSSYGGTEFIGMSYTYDSTGRYVMTETDALGHVTTYSRYNMYGKPRSIIDYRGNETLLYYDDWGTCFKTVNADGEESITDLSWGGLGLYTVSTTSNSHPSTIVHYDALDRVLRTSVQRFDGQWQSVDKVYDDKGRLEKQSLPFRGDRPNRWTITYYDEYNRPVRVEDPSGNRTLISYSGTSVTTTKDGIASTKITDASGNVISASDVGGTIHYTLRDDGQPSIITAPGDVQTLFYYDKYGRRIKIVDPSAGVRTETYSDYSDGSSKIVSTNPNGTIITHIDKYGRTTKVERPGEYDTEYSYDEYGNLVADQSTNGCSKSYLYDNLNRITSAVETVPDGISFTKNYTYDVIGRLESVDYEGIATVEYEYRNGYNVGEKLSDGTYIHQLISENDLGLATRIRTGGIYRDYGYSETGLPTFRKMDEGRLQDFRYEFNPENKNLESRQDYLNGQTETFEYDNLNRLTRAGTRQFKYDQKGNITSIDGVGSLTYGNSARPYQVTRMAPKADPSSLGMDREQFISYTCYSRPSRIEEDDISASFTYNGDGERVKLYMPGSNLSVTRYYCGGNYEYEIVRPISRPGSFVQARITRRLYLGGDAYSAPMVYEQVRGNDWQLYNIGRDYLGSVTTIATADGELVAEYSYDPWGRLRNPQTLEIYAPGTEPELRFNRGYTGHEHLTMFGLINMNARLYDPLLGRFLSPDPYVQAPDFTQNFNRYSYCLNNPLKYKDPNGEIVLTTTVICGLIVGAALIEGGINLYQNRNRINGFWEGCSTFFVGALQGAATTASCIFSGGNPLIVTAVGGATSSLVTFNNELVARTGRNFEMNEDIDWDAVGTSTYLSFCVGVVTSWAGGYAHNAELVLNGTTIKSPIIKDVIGSSLAYTIGTGAQKAIQANQIGIPLEDFWDWGDFFKGLGFSMATSAGMSSLINIYEGINPITGDPFPFPEERGFLGGKSQPMTLPPGTRVSRYGDTKGTYVSPEGVPFKNRGLPSGYLDGKNKVDYQIYEITKPITVEGGIAAPHLYSPGGGVQYVLPQKVQYLLNDGSMIIVK